MQDLFDQQIGDHTSKISELTSLLESNSAQYGSEIDRLTLENNSLAADLKMKETQLNGALEDFEQAKMQYENSVKAIEEDWRQKIKKYADDMEAAQRSAEEKLTEKTTSLETEYEERLEALQRDFQAEIERKEEEWRNITKADADQRVGALMVEIEELKEV